MLALIGGPETECALSCVEFDGFWKIDMCHTHTHSARLIDMIRIGAPYFTIVKYADSYTPVCGARTPGISARHR